MVEREFTIDAPHEGKEEQPRNHRSSGSRPRRGTERQGKTSSARATVRPATHNVKLVPQSQKATVKGVSSSHFGKHSWGKYGRNYLERDGVSKEQGPGVGFDKDGETSAGETMKTWQQAGDQEYYRVVLSPERSEDLDLTRYTREVMTKVENDYGANLEWVAVKHHYENGEKKHPHVHVMIRGITEQGNRIEMSDQYLKRQFRGHAEEIATNHLGYRLTDYAVKQREKTLGREAFTETDRDMWFRKDGDRRVKVEDRADLTPAEREKNRQEVQRLAYLVEEGLAKKTGEREWELQKRLPSELNFRAANREFAPAWREQPEQQRETQQQNERQRVVRIVEDERQQGIER